MRHRREEVIARAIREFELLDRLVGELSDEEWERPLLRSESKQPWTVKDALAHITHWKADTARSIRRQRIPPEERGLSISDGNQLVYMRWRDRSPQEVLAWHRQVQKDVLSALREAPEDYFSGRERKADWPFDLDAHSADHRVKDIQQALETGSLSPALIAEITEIVFGPLLPGEPQPCEAIFVFGGSYPGLWEKTAEAYQRGLGKDIIITGGYNPTAQRHPTWQDGDTPEAHVIRRELIRLGVPASVITYEDRSTNSLENVLFAKEVYDFSGVSRLLAVCKCYGVGRQCRTLEGNLEPSIQVVPYSFDAPLGGKGPVVTRLNWMAWEESRQFAIRQVAKIREYGERGHLKPVENFSSALLKLIQKS